MSAKFFALLTVIGANKLAKSHGTTVYICTVNESIQIKRERKLRIGMYSYILLGKKNINVYLTVGNFHTSLL